MWVFIYFLIRDYYPVSMSYCLLKVVVFVIHYVPSGIYVSLLLVTVLISTAAVLEKQPVVDDVLMT